MFIELTIEDSGGILLLHKSHTGVVLHQGKVSVFTYGNSEDYWYVNETYEEVKAKLAGNNGN
jgi:hypothetical protein